MRPWIFGMALVHILSSAPLASARCGGDAAKTPKYSALPLQIDKFSPRLAALKPKLIPDKKNGWAFKDYDQRSVFFKPAASGALEPCFQSSDKSEPLCGQKLIDRHRNRSLKLTGYDGQPAAEVTFTGEPRPTILIKAIDSAQGEYLRLTAQNENKDNTNYSNALKIEGYNFEVDANKPVAVVNAQRPMLEDKTDQGGG